MGTEQQNEPNPGNEQSTKAGKTRHPWWFNQELPIDRFTGWLVAWTALLFIATVINAVILGITDHTLKETLIENRKVAVSTETAAKSAERSAKLAEDALIASNRAWLAPITALSMNKIAVGKPFNIAVTYRNIGKEPAIDVTYNFSAERVAADPKYPGWGGDFGKKKNEMCVQESESDKGVAYPGGADQYAVTYSIEPEFVDAAIMRAQLTFYIQGCIRYLTFSQVHHAAYCFYLHNDTSIPSEKWGWRFCPYGNNSD